MSSQEVIPNKTYTPDHKRFQPGTVVRVWRDSSSEADDGKPFYMKGAVGVVVDIPLQLRMKFGRTLQDQLYLVKFTKGDYATNVGVWKVGHFLVPFDIISAVNNADIVAIEA